MSKVTTVPTPKPAKLPKYTQVEIDPLVVGENKYKIQLRNVPSRKKKDGTLTAPSRYPFPLLETNAEIAAFVNDILDTAEAEQAGSAWLLFEKLFTNHAQDSYESVVSPDGEWDNAALVKQYAAAKSKEITRETLDQLNAEITTEFGFLEPMAPSPFATADEEAECKARRAAAGLTDDEFVRRYMAARTKLNEVLALSEAFQSKKDRRAAAKAAKEAAAAATAAPAV